MPPELRAVCGGQRGVHTALAELPHGEAEGPTRVAYHRYRSGDGSAFEALVEGFLRITTLRKVPVDLARAVEIGLDLRLEPAASPVRARLDTWTRFRQPESIRDLRLRAHFDDLLRRVESNPSMADEAAVAWCATYSYGETPGAAKPEVLAPAARLCGRLGRSPQRLVLSVAIATALWQSGDEVTARSTLKRALAREEGDRNAPDDALWGRCLLAWLGAGRDGLVLLESWDRPTAPWVSSFRDTVLATILQNEGRMDAALACARRAVSTPDHPIGATATLSSLLLAEGRLDEALQVISDGIVASLAIQPRVANDDQFLLLALTLEGPRPQWEDLLRMTRPGSQLAPIVRRFVETLPESERTRALLERLGGASSP
jgi:hypothetical protein